MKKENFLSAITELRKSKKRNFEQTIDLIINLCSFDVKKESINIFVTLPYLATKKKICAFLEHKSNIFDTITKKEFDSYKGKELKKLVKKYDFFAANAKLMPSVATAFGKVLGPAGKMPSPKLGIVTTEDEKALSQLKEKIEKIVHIKTKESSIKVAIGKESMPDEQIAENSFTVYHSVIETLPRKKENIKNVMLKLTMSKPVRVEE